MDEKNPAPEGFESRCGYCGRLLVGVEEQRHLADMPDADDVSARFCSEGCERAYEALTDEERTEMDELYRSGPT